MAVYVDDYRASFGRMKMCHMMADTHRELMEMATKIGVAHRWLQRPGRSGEHFDVCLAKRDLAIQHGARLLDVRELAQIEIARRGAQGRRLYFEEAAPA